MSRRFRFIASGLTHEGLVRSANEDAHLLRNDVGLWAVADGMGGHENGQWAAATIVAALARAPFTGDFGADVGVVEAAMAEANSTIREQAEKIGKRMGSTTVVLMADGRRFACLWVGDSRIYRLRGDTLERLTRDHTQVQEMVDKGILSAAEADDHPMGHVLSRAVGVEEPLRLDVIDGELDAGDVFLLCSDGLSGVIAEEDIRKALTETDSRSAARQLMEKTMSEGAPDNVTLITVACEEMTALSLEGAH
jgi:serine/threonine protein phosphatase PrpC